MDISFDGMTRANSEGISHCPKVCTAERCVISTVAVCKHPHKSGNDGCGPITMANRAAACKYLGISLNTIKHSDVIR
jgi:hypothetical protein